MGGNVRKVGQLAEAAARLRQAVLDRGEATPAALRRAAFEGSVSDPALAGFVATVREHAYRITDADVVALRGQGLSDDAIFEITVAAALGAAQRRLDVGLALLTVDGRR